MAFVYWLHLPEHTDIFSEGYIGFTSKTVEHRYKGHLKEAKRNRTFNYPVYNAIRKYGNSLVLDTIVDGADDYCLDIESKLRPERKIGWNLQEGGNKGTKGIDVTAETREKISAAGKGRVLSEAHKKAIGDSNRKEKHSEEVRLKMSLTRKGLPRAAGSCEKQKQTLKNCPWRSSMAIKSVWASSNFIYQEYLKNTEISAHALAKIFNTSESRLLTVVKKLRAGWIPSECIYWRAWISEYTGSKLIDPAAKAQTKENNGT